MKPSVTGGLFYHMGCGIEGCTAPVENEETGLCARHGFEERRSARKKAKPKKTYTIPKVSEQGKRRKKAIAATYKVMDASQPHVCSACGIPLDPMGSHSHLAPRSQYPEHEAAQWNLVYDCIACHEVWEHGSWEAVQTLSNIRDRVRTLLKNCPQYLFRRFILKNPEITLELLKNY